LLDETITFDCTAGLSEHFLVFGEEPRNGLGLNNDRRFGWLSGSDPGGQSQCSDCKRETSRHGNAPKVEVSRAGASLARHVISFHAGGYFLIGSGSACGFSSMLREARSMSRWNMSRGNTRRSIVNRTVNSFPPSTVSDTTDPTLSSLPNISSILASSGRS